MQRSNESEARQRARDLVPTAICLGVLAVGCGANADSFGDDTPTVSTIVVTVPPMSATSTSPPLPLLTVQPFVSIAPAGAYPVIEVPAGGYIPDDLAPGHYRVRIAGQEEWPEECLGEMVIATPSTDPPYLGPPTGQVDFGSMEANQAAYEAEYARICSSLTSARPATDDPPSDVIEVPAFNPDATSTTRP